MTATFAKAAALLVALIAPGCLDTDSGPPMVTATSAGDSPENWSNQDVLRQCNTPVSPHDAPYSAQEVENVTSISSRERLRSSDRELFFEIAARELKSWNGTRYKKLEGTLAPTSPSNQSPAQWRLDLTGYQYGVNQYTLEFEEGSDDLSRPPWTRTVAVPVEIWNHTARIINNSDVGHLSPSTMTWNVEWDWCLSVVLHPKSGNRAETREPYYEAVVDTVAGQVLNVERRSWESPALR